MRTLRKASSIYNYSSNGAIGTAAYGILVLKEDSSVIRLLCFALIIAGIVGLKVLSAPVNQGWTQ